MNTLCPNNADAQACACAAGCGSDPLAGDSTCRPRREPSNSPSACGPKCLQEALRRLGLGVGLPELLRRCKTSHEGTSIRDLLSAAQSLGLRALVCKAGLDQLARIVLPAHRAVIAHVHPDHFVVVESVNCERLRVWDPNEGACQWRGDEFRTAWAGVCIVISAPDSR